MRFCSNCGTPIEEGSKFCPNCGTKLEIPVPAIENPATQVPATETPVAVTPAVETPAAETPVAEAPVTPDANPTDSLFEAAETPNTGSPVTEAPVPETPAPQPTYTTPSQNPYEGTSQYSQAPQTPQVPYYQAPHTYQTPPYAPPAPERKANVCGIIGLVLSCIGLLFCWLSIFNGILIPALVLVIIGLVQMKDHKKAAAITGAVIYLVALILTIVMTVVYVSIPFTAQFDEEDYNYSYNYNFDNDDESIIADKLSRAYDLYCDDSFAYLSFDGSYLYVDTNPSDIKNETDTNAWTAIQDINDYLGLPDSLDEQMKNTRALDGYCEESFDDIDVSWNYHPDTGLEVYYEVD
ncbi:MAG: zinc-ribbon domain-containing protein [Ruminococcaceae bacterium]|nr:zinc-ribbon domain-containing protein [Oscillospiraceae bacterium]